MKFIADIASNHDGDLNRAKRLIELAKESGATHAKFQHFKADEIVSKTGFEIVGKLGHQGDWKESVFETYQQAELNREWTITLAEHCKTCGIEFMSSAYDKEAVDLIEPYVNYYKIGSGDITHAELLRYTAKKGKPIILATGASSIEEVTVAFNEIYQFNYNITLMQCNTDYTGKDNYKYLNLGVLKKYKYITDSVGLSDHTKDIKPIIIAVTLGAEWIERHFTDDDERIGPDHHFAMTPCEYSDMVRTANETLEIIGDGIKKIEANEIDTSVIQRRAWYANKDMIKGERITPDAVKALRPCAEGMIPANYHIINNELLKDVAKEQPIYFEHIYEKGE